MSTDKRITLQQAAEIITDGSRITFSGFTIWRRPMAIVFELIRQRRKNLHLIEVNGGSHTEFLVGAGCVDIWESCWVGHELYGKYGANLSRKVAEKQIIVEDYSHAEMMFRFAAAAQGAAYAVTQTSLGTPRRTTIGVDHNRLALLVAVLEKKVGLHLAWQDSRLRLDDPSRALTLFKSNTWTGLLLFAALVIGGWRG